MEQSLSDLLSDALSDDVVAETSVPSFLDGDLDFGNFNFDEKFEEDEKGASDEDGARHQEGTGETALMSNMETKDIHKSDSVDKGQSDDNNEKEDFQGVGVSLVSMDRTAEEDYTSSDGEGSASGEDEDMGTGEKPGDLLMSVCCSDEFCDGNKEDRIFAEGQPLAPEGAENPQVRNEEQGESESESDEEVSYFGQVPERGSEVMIKGDGIEDDERKSEEDEQEDSSDSECESMKVEQEENVFAQCLEQEVESPFRGDPATTGLEFPEISEQNLQVLVAEVDSEVKMKDFSEEEHQEAGESFADYPSDFSSCEFVEDGVKSQASNSLSSALPRASDSCSNAKQNVCLEGAVTDITWMGTEEDADEQGDLYLSSSDLETEAVESRSFQETAGEKDKGQTDIVEKMLGEAAVTVCDDEGETGESDSYSSSDDDDDDDDEVQEGRREEELLTHICPQHDTLLDSVSSAAFSRWSNSDDQHITNNRVEPSDFHMKWDFDVSKTASILFEDPLTTEDTDRAETLLLDVSQRPAEDVSSYSVVQRESSNNTSPSYQGSLDDSFFFNTELQASGVTELGPLGENLYEEERSWEQEEERIKAFFKFYDDSEGEDEREERPIKVQFCADPLSQVIHYETDSDRDSLSSSTDREEDLSSAETSEEPRDSDDTLQTIPACDPPDTRTLSELENNLSNTHICSRKCLCMLKLILKMGLVIAMGLLVFWLATDQPDWLSQASFF
ncbi:FK506-binding protein 5 isoform X2 [Scophthalmus maximus]|uniref:FK506-binding protein 5 isoform X2 n=1 Tax=Scophthalmus maximus TaxID=52904 RepID=UPI001FA838BE|nr:FK506-binding protein 5 isoform X2 [Scophthalmus maximus]